MKKRILALVLSLLMLLAASGCQAAGNVTANLYEVHYELNGGSLVSGELLQQVPEGGNAAAPVVERDGYVFAGWSDDGTNVRSSRSIVAQWTPAETEPELCEVRFELNGGSLVSGQLLQRIPVGGSAEAPVAERAGFAFDGWSPELTQITENTVAVAQWARLYEIRFDLAGGTAAGELTQYLRSGETPTVPTPTKENAVFLGWSAEPVPAAADAVYTARWEEHYTITFDPGEGTVVSGETTQILIAGEMPTPPEVALEGSELAGWSPELQPAAGDTVYTARWTVPEVRTLSAEEVFALITPSVVTIVVSDRNGEPFSLGSGFFISDQGVLVTNRHVVEGGYSAVCYLQDGSEVGISSVLAQDPDVDLVILQADITGNPWLETETGVTTGETVYALGSPHGLTESFTSGIVSNALRYDENEVAHIQFTAPISSGNSGGPLVNSKGRVIGVNTMTRTDSQNINYAVKITELGTLDQSRPITMSVFGQETNGNQQTPASQQTGGFYGDGLQEEVEPNDSAVLADELPYDTELAADLGDYYDIDIFRFTITEPDRYAVALVPYDSDQAEAFTMLLVTVEGEEAVEVGEVQYYDIEGGVVLGIEENLEPGDYYVLVTADEDWESGDYPLYYQIFYTLHIFLHQQYKAVFSDMLQDCHRSLCNC